MFVCLFSGPEIAAAAEKLILRVQRGWNFIQGVFSNLESFVKKIEIDPLCNVAALEANVVTLKEVENTSLYHVTTLVDHILEPSL